MRVLVTGGAGYVGSHALRQLHLDGHDAWAYDDLSRGHAGAVPAGVLIRGELDDRRRLAEILTAKRIEAVMHFAAFADVGESVSDPELYYRNNVGGSLSLLAAMRSAGVHRIVFSSSCAVYGTPACTPIAEDAPTAPVSPYGFTKLAVERALADYAAAYRFGFAALRYFNASGAEASGDIGEDHDPETHAIPAALQVALGRRDHFTLFGADHPTPDGTCIRDYVHVDDLARAHAIALEHLSPGTGLHLNLGSGRGSSVREVLDACRRVTGHAIPVVEGARRPGDPPALVADPSRAQQILGWKAHCSELDEIVASAWRWHEKHPLGFGSKRAKRARSEP